MNIRQILRINKIIFYIPIGIIIIIFREHLINYLSLIVGIPMLVFSSESLIYEIIIRNYRNEYNRLGEETIKIILSILIIFAFNNNVELIAITWGIIAILQALKELSKSIYELTSNKKLIYFLVLAQSLIQIGFAILLISDPHEHVSFHLVILGVEMEIESLRIFIDFIITKKKQEKLNLKEE